MKLQSPPSSFKNIFFVTTPSRTHHSLTRLTQQQPPLSLAYINSRVSRIICHHKGGAEEWIPTKAIFYFFSDTRLKRFFMILRGSLSSRKFFPGSSNAAVLIVPQVFMMYYGGFYIVLPIMAVCTGSSSNGVEKEGCLQHTRWNLLYFLWKMDFSSSWNREEAEFNMSGGWNWISIY